MSVFLQVIDPDLLSRIDELLGHPGTDASVAARHQDPHLVFSCMNRHENAGQAHQPDGRPQTPGVINSTELPAGSRK